MTRTPRRPGTRRLFTIVAAAAAVATLAALVPVAGSAAEGTSPTALYEIPLRSGTVDPARDFAAALPRARDLVLVQFERFGDTRMVHRVARTGARMVQPLAPVSYLVWANAAQTRAIRSLAGVRWAGVMPSSARIAPDVAARSTRLRVTVVGGLDARALPDLTVQPRAFTQVPGAIVHVSGNLELARRLASLPRVYSIADASSAPQLREERSNAIITQGTKSGPLRPEYRSFLTKHAADGSGVIVSHVDGGVDINHPELSDRIQACIGYGTDGPVKCTARNHDDPVGHGTHTLGTVLGNGSTGLGDLDGFDYGLGVAPGAKAVVQNAIHTGRVGTSPFANGYRPVYRQANDLGAIASQNSWGPSGTPRGYDANTREFDSIVRDVNETTAGDQAMGLVFSIMNGGGGTSTQGTPDEGKNIIGVGATGNRGVGAPGVDDLCTCSAHGPALDGRLLPTVVAPGQQVISTRAAQGTLCGVPFIGYSPTTPATETPPSPLHAGCTGTSMASPHVTGAYAVFVDWYRDHHSDATPSPALVKAALVNGAVDLAGAKDADGGAMGHIPNNKQGWGRVNLANVLDGWTAGEVHVDQSVVFTATGDTHELSVEPIDATKPLKVTLAWTDALGPGLGGNTPAWINDLDLTVTSSDGTAWLGNVFANGISATGGDADRKNNLENVYLAAPGAGTFTVTVSAANILGDGMPNREGLTDQDFALVITNARAVTG